MTGYLCQFCPGGMVLKTTYSIDHFAKHLEDHVFDEQKKQPLDMNIRFINSIVKYRNKLLMMKETGCASFVCVTTTHAENEQKQ